MAPEMRLPPEIEKYYQKWEKDPNSRVFAQLADAYRKSGMLDEGIEVCLEGLKVHPSYGSARMVLARSYQEKGMDAEAEKEFLEVVKNDPDNILAHRMLADLLYQGGRIESALEQYREVVKLTPFDREMQGILEKIEADVEVASPVTSAVAEEGEGKDEATLRGEPGVIPVVKEKREDTTATSLLLSEKTEEDVFLTETVADLYLKQGFHHQAAEIFSQMLAADPDNPHIEKRLQEAILLQQAEKSDLTPPEMMPREPEEVQPQTTPSEEEPLFAEPEAPSLSPPENLLLEPPTAESPDMALPEFEGPSSPSSPLVRGKQPVEILHRWLEAVKHRRNLLREKWVSLND